MKKYILRLSLMLALPFGYNANAQIITTIAGNGVTGYGGDGGQATAASISDVRGIAMDGAGNIYLSDFTNQRIRKINSSGIITTIAGTGAMGYNGDGGPATAAWLYNPQGILVDTGGNLYFGMHAKVRKINSTGIINPIAGDPAGAACTGGDGGPATATIISIVEGITSDGMGNIYFAGGPCSKIRKVSPSGIITTVCGTGIGGFSGDGGPATAAQIYYPTGLTSDLHGNIYFIDAGSRRIRRISSSGIITTIAGTGVTGFSGDGGPATAARISPDGEGAALAIDAIGNLYFGDRNNYRIRKIDTFGIISTIAGTGIPPGYGGDGGPATAAAIALVLGIAVDKFGNVYIGDLPCRVRKISCTPPAAGTLIGSSSLCTSSTTTLSNTVIGGIWSSSTAIATVGSTGIVSGIAAGTTTISYTVTNLCSSTVTTKSITVNPLPVSGTVTGASSVCVFATTPLSSTITGGIWTSSEPIVASVDSASGIVSGATTGTAIITYSVTNGCGTAIATHPMTVNSLPIAGTITGAAMVCVSATTALTSTVSGGTWTSTATSIATVDTSTGVITGVAAGTTTIRYSLTNMCDTAYTTKNVTVNPLPIGGSIAGPSSICAGETTTITSSSSGGTWKTTTGNASITSGALLRAVSVGGDVVSYTVSSAYCGSASATMAISVAPIPSINEDIINAPCFGLHTGSITIHMGNEPYLFTWSNGNSTSIVNNLSAGTYTLKVTDSVTGCSRIDSFSVSQPDSILVKADIYHDNCQTSTGEINLTLTGGTIPYSYLWSNNITNSSISGLKQAIYTVSISDANNCKEEMSYTINDSCSQVVIHNGISPNGDGINDVWTIEKIEDYPENVVQIFDKFGDAVYKQNGYNNNWNGVTGDGKLLPDGSYFYLVKLNSSQTPGNKNVFTGTIIIKR